MWGKKPCVIVLFKQVKKIQILIIMSSLTFPHGESHEGSPGLEDFHKAKSFGECFSLKRSAEMLRSPFKREM